MTAITGQFIPREELQRILDNVSDPIQRAKFFADACRLNTLYMIRNAGSGHIGTSFSCVDILSFLYLVETDAAKEEGSDIIFSSKGHDVPALYSILLGLGLLPFDKLHALRRLGGLPGHPDVSIPHIVTNTGSLGMGIAKARGMVKAARLNNSKLRVFVILGDGELQEGQIYESLQPTANGGYGEINVIIDHNKIQSDTWVKDVSDLADLASKFKAFGWEVARCDGHDLKAVSAVLDVFRTITDRPKVLIADTIKGKGVSFMERYDAAAENGQYKFHNGAPSAELFAKASAELITRLQGHASQNGLEQLTLSSRAIDISTPPSQGVQNLVTAYSQELLSLGAENENLVVLDGDLARDCGVLPFKAAYPDRFVECGIAEQDMVSMAGGLALRGKLPVVHSFACFLSTRPNEQIFNNATERTKIIYAGSLAGLLPSGPGHSHQSLRDISLLGSIPGMRLIQPSTEDEARLSLRWAVKESPGSTYIRITTVPTIIPYSLPEGYQLHEGRGCVLHAGEDAVVFAYGPTMLSQAYLASILLAEQGHKVAVINLPWLNIVDLDWFNSIIADTPVVFSIEDHFTTLGQSSIIANALASTGSNARFFTLGVSDLPKCGRNDEVLAFTGLDAHHLFTRIRERLA